MFQLHKRIASDFKDKILSPYNSNTSKKIVHGSRKKLIKPKIQEELKDEIMKKDN